MESLLTFCNPNYCWNFPQSCLY